MGSGDNLTYDGDKGQPDEVSGCPISISELFPLPSHIMTKIRITIIFSCFSLSYDFLKHAVTSIKTDLGCH